VAGKYVLPRAHGHHDFLEGRIPGPLAQAVYRALHLPRSVHHRGEGIGHGESEIVMTVHRPDRLVGVRYSLAQASNERPKLVRHRVSDGIWSVHGPRPLPHHGPEYAAQKSELGAPRVFG